MAVGEMRRSLSEYLRRVGAHWWALAVGAAGGLVGIVTVVTGWSLPAWVWVTVLLAGVVVAQFLAFHDLFNERRAQWPPPGKGLRGWRAGHVWIGQPQTDIFLWLLPPPRASDDDTVRCGVSRPGEGAVVSRDDPVRLRRSGEYGVLYPSAFQAPPAMMDGTYTVIWSTRRDILGIRMLRKHRFRVRDGQPERGAAPAELTGRPAGQGSASSS
jgi:hypothetical protein